MKRVPGNFANNWWYNHNKTNACIFYGIYSTSFLYQTTRFIILSPAWLNFPIPNQPSSAYIFTNTPRSVITRDWIRLSGDFPQWITRTFMVGACDYHAVHRIAQDSTYFCNHAWWRRTVKTLSAHFHRKKLNLKMSSAKWQPFVLAPMC